MSVGVVIGRFQVPDLSPGHKFILEYAAARHDNLIIILGSSQTNPTVRNPLSYQIRAGMLIAYMKEIGAQGYVARISDFPSDQMWSDEIDHIISKQYPEDRKVVLYGSRDSFIPHYKGRYLTEEIKTVESLSGTDLREALKANPDNTAEFRAGVIYGQLHKFPTSYQVVDVAVVKDNKVLMGHKKTDPDGQYRFIGGFVDPSDSTLERAARREVMEEVDVETDAYTYIGSTRIDDWRFRDGPDKMLSAMFVSKYVFGAAIAKDDIIECKWIDIDILRDVVIETHKPLLELFINYWHGEGNV